MPSASPSDRSTQAARRPLYTAAERARRDATPWTLVQGVLAPLQFAVFLLSVVLVLRCLVTGEGAAWAHLSVLAKTFLLFTIMATGCLWEKAVFGRYLFAPAFFWEDVVSFLVMALHGAYLLLWWRGSASLQVQLGVALLAYAAYLVNAGQFLWKLRLARRDADAASADSPRLVGLA